MLKDANEFSFSSWVLVAIEKGTKKAHLFCNARNLLEKQIPTLALRVVRQPSPPLSKTPIRSGKGNELGLRKM